MKFSKDKVEDMIESIVDQGVLQMEHQTEIFNRLNEHNQIVYKTDRNLGDYTAYFPLPSVDTLPVCVPVPDLDGEDVDYLKGMLNGTLVVCGHVLCIQFQLDDQLFPYFYKGADND